MKPIMRNGTDNSGDRSRINNDFFSQSYCQSTEGIMETKKNTFDFEVPEELLEIKIRKKTGKKKTGDKFFEKYSEEILSEIESNVDTLEPEDEIGEKENSCALHLPMRKSANLVQYWVNTGNPPCKMLLDESNSNTGSSLSEKRISLPSCSTILNEVNENCKQRQRINTSCSSKDTIANIPLNANIPQKVDTIAIIEDMEFVDVNSLKDTPYKDTKTACNNRIINNNVESIRVDHVYSNAVTSVSAARSNTSSHSLFSDKANKSDTNVLNNNVLNSQRSTNVRHINDIISIFRQFDKTSKRLSGSCKNDNALSQNDASEKHISDNEQNPSVSACITAEKTVTRDAESSLFHLKKLYTGRNSPVDLMLIKKRSTNKLSQTKVDLHPALDPDDTIKKRISFVRKGRNKQQSLFNKKDPNLRKVERKEKENQEKERKKHPSSSSSVCSKNTTDIRDEIEITNSENRIEDSVIDDPRRVSLDSRNNSHISDNDVPIGEYNETVISLKNNTYKEDLASLNLKPIVLLERIAPSFEQYKSKSIENYGTTQKNNMPNDRYLNISKKSNTSKIANLTMESIGSNVSTAFICKCGKTASEHRSSSSDCTLQLRLSEDDEISISSAQKKSSELVKMKNTDTSHCKKVHVVLERLSESVIKNYTSATKSQVLNTCSSPLYYGEKDLNKSKTHPNLHGTDKIVNDLQEFRIVLERLSPNTCFKKGRINRNISVNKEEISHTNLHDKEKLKTSVPRNIKTFKTSYKSDKDSSEIYVKSKKKKISEVKSNSASRYKNGGIHDSDKESYNKYSKYSVSNLISSDEELINLQPLKKRSRISIGDKTLGKSTKQMKVRSCDKKSIITNKDKYSKLNAVNHSSKKTNVDNAVSSVSLMRENKIFSFSQNECDSNSDNNHIEKPDKCKKKYLLLNRKQNRNNSSKMRFNTTNKRNETKDDAYIILLRTKILDIDSSDSERSNKDIAPTSKPLKHSHHNSQYHNRVNKERFSNDPIVKKYIRKEINLSNSVGKRTVANEKARNARKKSGLLSDEETEESERLNENINSNVNDTNKYVICSSIINKRNTYAQKKNSSSLNISVENDNHARLSKNQQVVTKSNVRSSLITQQYGVIPKSSTLETKTYYHSDTS